MTPLVSSGFSPHAWGWTVGAFDDRAAVGVFPTRVGVDRARLSADELAVSFPHTRGGGPQWHKCAIMTDKFSPHAWGWTYHTPPGHLPGRVFPTRVGVDRNDG